MTTIGRSWIQGWRGAVVSVFASVALTSCGGDGGSSTPTPPPVQTAQLVVTIGGLPAGAQAAVTITGPATSATATATTTLSNLAAGNYTVAATNSVASGSVFAPQTVTQTITATAGGVASVTVTYAIVRLALQAVVANLDTPLWMTLPAGDARLFIVERPGRVRVLKSGSLLPTPFLDISARIGAAGEGGLISIAFDPNYATNGFFYAYFTDTNQNIAIERFHVSTNPDVADPSPLRIISIPHPVNTNHYGGELMFGPDGMLYAGIGDGGGAGDQPGNAQNLNVLLGKIIRIDVRTSGPTQPYVIPADNPFVAAAGQRPEIWHYGLRNPWRYAFDNATTRLYVADVGQDREEEVDVVPTTSGGLNFGWNILEGTQCFLNANCSVTGTVVPVLHYEHDANGGCAITGGFVYRGAALPALVGRYFYSDVCSGFVRSFALVNGVATEQVQWPVASVGSVNSFAVDGSGELYVLSANGTVYRIVAG
jgi:glucose/arabinose dehydrogenase